MGHRNALGLTIHPDTAAVCENENGPNGGDEVNLILPARNYGWLQLAMAASIPGRAYRSTPGRKAWRSRLVVWLPSIGISRMTFYSADKFPG
jgi:glucose/arabinose dehydrogenase